MESCAFNSFEGEFAMTIVVTRHIAFVDYCLEQGLIREGGFEVIPHAKAEDIEGKEVVASGLPFHLAALCTKVTTVPLFLPKEKRCV